MTPSRALRICGHSGCPTLVPKGSSRCPAHTVTQEERREKDPAQRKFYRSTQWTQISKLIRRQRPMCEMCRIRPSQQVHHIDENWRNNAPENLQAVCKTCHDEYSGRQHRRKGNLGPIVVLCGPAGSGKTTIRNHLAPMLGAVALGPDDFDAKWTEVYVRMASARVAVVECCTPPGALVREVRERGALVVAVEAPSEVRRQRLAARGHTPQEIEYFAGQGLRLGYEEVLEAHLVVDATRDPATVAQEVARAFRERA